jgi:hypothetical protein
MNVETWTIEAKSASIAALFLIPIFYGQACAAPTVFQIFNTGERLH